MLTRRTQPMLTRRTQRHIKNVVITGGILLLLIGAYHLSISPSTSSLSTLDKDDNFYHDFEIQDKGFYEKINLGSINSKLESNKKRSLKTRYGLVSVKDILFVPKNELPKGANIYKFKQFPEWIQKNKDKIPMAMLDLDKPQHSNRNDDIILRGFSNSNSSKFAGNETVNYKEALEKKRYSYSLKGAPQDKQGNNNSMCVFAPCKEYLSYADLPHFKYCRKKSKMKSNYEPSSSACVFRQSDSSAAPPSSLALASSPGSGAVHIRRLLQEVTGLCTGSIYCNSKLRRAGFPGECLRTSTVLVVQTHQLDPTWYGMTGLLHVPPRGFNKMVDVPFFGSAVYLIRDPYEAMLEEWSSMKELDTNPGNFTTEKWESFVSSFAVAWQQTILNWLLSNKNHPVLVVRYEDMKLDTVNELRRILNFLGVPYNTDKLDQVTWRDENQVLVGTAKLYSTDELMYVNTIIKATTTALSVYTSTKHIDLNNYLNT